jgi:hypothetical protein
MSDPNFLGATEITSDASLNSGISSDGFYYADASTISAFDTSGYVFEIGEFDISHSLTIDPSFERIIKQLAVLGDCSAAAVIDVSASQFNGLLSFKTDSADLSNADATDVSFGVGSSAVDNAVFDNIAFSESVVYSGNINSSYTDTQHVKYDYVRDTAKQITGGYNSADIFSNEAELVQNVVTLDASFIESLQQAVFDNSSVYLDKVSASTSDNSLILAAQNLFTLNLNDDNNTRKADFSDVSGSTNGDYTFEGSALTAVETGDSVEELTMRVGMLAEVGLNSGGATNEPVECPLRFAKGDKIAIKLTYHPNQTSFAANGVALYARSYKVYLNLN